MLSELKPKLQPLINAVAKPFLKVNPNILSIVGMIFPVLFLYFMVRHEFGWAFAMAIGTSFDTLDGAVAKLSNRVTKLGALLDSTLDRLSDALMIIGFYYAGLLSLELALIVLVESYLISYIRSRAELAAKGDFVLNVGIIERPERIITLLLALLFKILNLPETAITAIFIILAVLSLITIMQRMIIAGKRLSR